MRGIDALKAMGKRAWAPAAAAAAVLIVASAAPTGPASVRQPCEGEDHSVTSGTHRVEYTSTLTEETIRQHYAAVARASGWRPVPDPRSDQLVYAKKWERDRCLELSVVAGHASVGGTASHAGDYTVYIWFGPGHHRMFCDDD